MNNWQLLKQIHPQALTEARLQLHYAIQYMAAVGNFLTESKPDSSQASISFNPQLNLFLSNPVLTETPFQVALDSINLISMIFDLNNKKLAEFPLINQTLNEGMEWLKQEIKPLGVDMEKLTFVSYPDDFPDHYLAHNRPFDSTKKDERQELTNYFKNTQILFSEIVSQTPKASLIHIWPHHFDLGATIPIDGEKFVGFGMSPGDNNYNEPYWYVYPWPYPDPNNLPSIINGIWHTKDWIGGVLIASQLDSGSQQQYQVKSFLDSAIQTSLNLLR